MATFLNRITNFITRFLHKKPIEFPSENLHEKQIEEQKIKSKRNGKTIVLKPSANNKDIIQSYVITAAKYDFSVYEKRIFYRVIECIQYQLKGKELNKDFSIDEDLSNENINIKMPVSSLLLKNEKDNHHERIKTALSSLRSKHFIYETSKIWEDIGLIEDPKVYKYSRIIEFRLNYKIYKALLDFSKGYRKFELETAMKFKSVYAMRFYELFSEQKAPITYTIEFLRNRFQLEDKYKLKRDFIRYVIDQAKKELDKKSPYSFTYKLEHEKGKKKITAITFTPINQSEKRSETLVIKDRQKEFDITEVLIREEFKALLEIGFTEQELKTKYLDLIQDIGRARKQGKILFTTTISDYSKKKKNPKTYLIKALETEIRKYKEELSKQKPSSLSKEERRQAKEYRQDKESVRSYLKNELNLKGKELENGTVRIMSKGGNKFLGQLFDRYDENKEKIREYITKQKKVA